MRQHGMRRGNGGFTYLTIMLLIVVMGILLGATTEVWHTGMQREKERELLFIGTSFAMPSGCTI